VICRAPTNADGSVMPGVAPRLGDAVPVVRSALAGAGQRSGENREAGSAVVPNQKRASPEV